MGTKKMERKNILWLVSWYPNAYDLFDGDFIQRHAKAAAIHHNIYVLFVKEVDRQHIPENELRESPGLTEKIIYYKRPKGILSKPNAFVSWRMHYLNAIKDYIKCHGKPSVVHVHIPWKAGLIALELKTRYRLKYIVTEHWGIYNKKVNDNITHRPYLIQKLWKRIIGDASLLISVSNYLGKGINKYLIKKSFTVIPNVVDTSLFCYSDDKHPTFTFIHVSNMVELKNVDGILDAFYKLIQSGCDQCRLIMIGNRHQSYARKAQEMGLLNKTLFFLGEISYEEVAREMQQAHCLIINSSIETFSCVVAESLCVGIPVISTKTGALPELINDENGILIKPGATKELSEAMKTMLEQYFKFDKKTISKNATAKYGYTSISKAFENVYKEI